MNLKLEVKRLNNEDVIATSGTEFCTDHNTHYYITGSYQDFYYPETQYDYDGNSWSYYSNWHLISQTDIGLQQGHYYVSDGSGGYVECTKNHDTTNVSGSSH